MQRAFQGARPVNLRAGDVAGEGRGGELTEMTEDLVERFLARAVTNDAIDFVDAFARQVASATMSAILGVSPTQTAQLDPALRAVGALDFGMSSPSIEHRQRIELWLLRELTRVVRAHRGEERSDGLIDTLLGAEISGRALSDHEVVLNCLNVVLAGTGATQHTLAGAMAVWSSHPGALDDVAHDPTLVDGLIEETLRWLTPVTHLTRIVTKSVEILGHEVPQGAGICLWNVSGNRDAEVFEESASFKPDRVQNRHLSFGIGAQYCLGARIVRMQLRVLLTDMLRHGVRFDPCGSPVWMQSNAIAGVESLPLRIRRECPTDARD
jgi:cytochrome P450